MKLKFSFLGFLIAALIICTSYRVDAAALGTDWNSQKITVTGTGVPTPGTYGAQARISAERAAIADAYRQLAEIVQGVQIDAETTVEMAMVKSDTIKMSVHSVVQGAKIINKNVTSDGACEITLELPMFGSGNSLAKSVWENRSEYVEPSAYIEPFPEPQSQRITASASVTIDVKGGYTGLVIDCRGFYLQPVMSPVIKNAKGQKIYGHKNLDYDKVIEYGMASYADSMSQAQRAGSNPLVVRAVKVDDFDANPVVSMQDAELILSENKYSNFLEDTAVVFLY